MKRLLAVIAAVAMIGAAWWIRTSIIDGSDSANSNASGTLKLTCGTDLAEVCNALAAEDDSIHVSIIAEGTTADGLSNDNAKARFDAWLTAGPWAQIVKDNRANRASSGAAGSNPLGGTSKVLGRSPVAFVGPKDRLDALGAHCGGTVTWTCLGEASGQPWSAVGGSTAWGTVKAGLAPPDSGAGLVALDQAVANKSDTTDWGTAELDDADAFMSQLVRAATIAADPLNVLLTQPGSFSVAAPLQQQSALSPSATANGSQFATLYPEPVVTADVTLTAAAGRDVSDLLDRIGEDRLATILAAHGWRGTGTKNADGIGDAPSLPPTSKLASPGALQALREQWKQQWKR